MKGRQKNKFLKLSEVGFKFDTDPNLFWIQIKNFKN